MELVGSDAVYGREVAAEDVVGAFVLLGGFDGVDVKRFFDDENRGLVARGVGVERREVFAGVDEGESFGARFDVGVERFECAGDGVGDLGAGAEQKVGVAFRRAGADARQVAESLNDVCQSFRKHLEAEVSEFAHEGLHFFAGDFLSLGVAVAEAVF